MRTEFGSLQPGRGFSRGAESVNALIWDFPTSRILSNKFLSITSYPAYDICYSSLNRLRHYEISYFREDFKKYFQCYPSWTEQIFFQIQIVLYKPFLNI